MVGDSIFAGAQSFPAQQSVGMLLPLLLGRKYSVINVACGASSAGSWSPDSQRVCHNRYEEPPFWSRLMPTLPADWVVVMLGTNDSHYWMYPPRPPADVGADYAAIAHTAIAHGAQRIMLVPPPPRPPGTPGGQRLAVLAAYGDEMRALCVAHEQIVCGPDLLELMDAETDFRHGNVHPNGPGHAKMAQLVADAILSYGDSNGLATD
jgi:lysophospholipase L1-like esterase